MQFEIYTYGNIEDISQVLLSIAHIAKDSAFLSITGSFILLAIAIGYMYFHVNSVMGKPADPLDPAKKLFVLLALVSVLVLTKGDAILYDPTLNQQKKVPDVPVGIVIPASFFSMIQKAVVDLLENNAPPIPKDAVMMGRSFDMLVALDRLPETYSKLHPCVMMNIKNYMRECYLPNAMRDNSLQDLLKPSNKSLFERIKVNDNSITLTYYTENPTTKECVASSNSYPCSEFYSKLDTDIKNTIPTSTSMLSQEEIFLKVCRAAVGNPNIDSIQCSGLLENLEDFINKAGTDGTVSVGLSKYAESQVLMDNMRDIYYNLISGSSTAKALYTARNSMISSQFASGVMASKYVKKLRSVMYAIVLALFPIIILLMALTGLAAFRWYFGMFVWLGLWGVVEAIMDLLARNHLYSILADIRDKGLSLDFMLEFPTKSVEMSSFYGNAEWLAGSVALAMTMGILKVGNYAVAQIAGQIGSNIQGAASGEGGKLGTHAGQTTVDRGFSENISTQAYREIYNSAPNAEYLGYSRQLSTLKQIGTGWGAKSLENMYGKDNYTQYAMNQGALTGSKVAYQDQYGNWVTVTGTPKGMASFNVSSGNQIQGLSSNISQAIQQKESALRQRSASLDRMINLNSSTGLSTATNFATSLLGKVGEGYTIDDFLAFKQQAQIGKEGSKLLDISKTIQDATGVSSEEASALALSATFLRSKGVDLSKIKGPKGIFKALSKFANNPVVKTLTGKLRALEGSGKLDHIDKNTWQKIAKASDNFKNEETYKEGLKQLVDFTSQFGATQSNMSQKEFAKNVAANLGYNENYVENFIKTGKYSNQASLMESSEKAIEARLGRDWITALPQAMVASGQADSVESARKMILPYLSDYYATGNQEALRKILTTAGKTIGLSDTQIKALTGMNLENANDLEGSVENTMRQTEQNIGNKVDQKTSKDQAKQNIENKYKNMSNKIENNASPLGNNFDERVEQTNILRSNFYKNWGNFSEDLENMKIGVSNKGDSIRLNTFNTASKVFDGINTKDKIMAAIAAAGLLIPTKDGSEIPTPDTPDGNEKEKTNKTGEEKTKTNTKDRSETQTSNGNEKEKTNKTGERKTKTNTKIGRRIGYLSSVMPWIRVAARTLFRYSIVGAVLFPEKLGDDDEVGYIKERQQGNKKNNNDPTIYKVPPISATETSGQEDNSKKELQNNDKAKQFFSINPYIPFSDYNNYKELFNVGLPFGYIPNDDNIRNRESFEKGLNPDDYKK